MGFSVTLASAIVLIGFLAIFASFSAALFQGIKELSCVAEEYVSRERERLDVNLQLTSDAVASARTQLNIEIRLETSATLSIEISVPASMPANTYVPVS
jgi:archaellum component FlaF (FlaF/FlaG flagellin family)